MLWMGIWVHRFTVIPVQVGAKFKKNGVRQSPNVLWCHGWGCKPPLTASHIYIGSIKSVKAPSYAVDGHMGAPLTVIPVQVGAKIWKIGVRWGPDDIVVSWLRLYTTTDCIPHPYWMCIKCLSTFICCGWACGCTLTLLYLCRWGPKFGKLG